MGEPLEECLHCDLKNLCIVRCPRLALAENGSLSAKSSRACELAAINSDLRRSLSGIDSGGSLDRHAKARHDSLSAPTRVVPVIWEAQ
jgi:hypothetical protein